MRIIPVLDLMNGQVVQAVRGEREHYRPVQSVLVSEAKPLSVARALQDETGCEQFYIADLDAIMGRGGQGEIVQELANGLEAELWVDAAINDAVSARRMLETGANRVIVCSETLSDWNALRAIRSSLPAERLLFSIDILTGLVQSRSPFLHGQDPLVWLDLLSQEGWSQFILLTLNQVGTGDGPDWELIRTANRLFPQLSLIAGGGVRTLQDLQQLAALNVSGVLVATSLHRGWITRKDLQTLSWGS
ncbi:MAG: HisA/HisF-related TIM barrel protein [Desulfobaccales bacterium]|jgi:phosphoribosylformimino-5-aminoimidazole carboxamide ribotide isomerase